jgi:hypothetical protein
LPVLESIVHESEGDEMTKPKIVKIDWSQPTIYMFKALVAKHDLTYAYSDDARMYRAGFASINDIYKMAKLLEQKGIKKDRLNKIWNDNVNKQMAGPYAKEFHWKN